MPVTDPNSDTAAQRLLEDGLCIMPDVLPHTLLQRLRETTQRLLEAQTPEQITRFRSQGSMCATTKAPCLRN